MSRPATPERWRRIQQVFEACADLSSAARQAVLDQECAEDQELRTAVQRLLDADQATEIGLGDVIRREAKAATAANATSTTEGLRLGPYRILRALAQGGMGAVYIAVRDDDQYRKQVAIKLLRRGLDSAEAVARFRDERQVLASLEHPGIVRLLDGGTSTGRPYLVMEYVEGLHINEYCQRSQLSVHDRVELVRRVCQAVQYAHRRLVVHRDIKPSNVVVGSDGAPKLLDFGIAKLLDAEEEQREARTLTGMLLFTPDYASPEQVDGDRVTVATDVHALGVVLYELLAGRRPFAPGGSVAEVMRAIRELEPPPPSAVAPEPRRRALRGDLDAIVLRALRKDPNDRYPSVEQLAADLERYLAGLPVLARSGTWTYRARKLIARRKGPIAAAILVGLALGAATAVSLQQARRAERHAAQLRGLASSLIFEVDEQIRDLEGSTTARKLIVSRAMEYLDALAEEAAHEPGLARERAIASIRIADILAGPRGPNLGRTDEAIACYQQGLDILRQLVANGDEDPVTSWELVRGLQQLGTLSQHDDQRPLARALLTEAGALAASLPHGPHFDHELEAVGVLTLFSIDMEDGSIRLAHQHAERLDHLSRTWASEVGSERARYFVGVAALALGVVAAHEAQVEEAKSQFERAQAVFLELIAQEPENAAYRREVTLALRYLAELHSGVGTLKTWPATLDDREAGERLWREALLLSERANARDPGDLRAAVELAATLAALGVALASSDLDAGVAYLDRAMEVWEGIPPATRDSGYERQFERATLCSSAQPWARAGLGAKARDAVERGLRLAALAAGDGTSLEGNVALAMCRLEAARALRVLGDTVAATELLASATEQLETILTSEPETIEPFIGLLQARAAWAELEPAARCAHLGRSLSSWSSWAGKSSSFIEQTTQQLVAATEGCREPG